MKSEPPVLALPLAEALARVPATETVVLIDATVRGSGPYRVLRVRQGEMGSEWVVAREPFRSAEEGKDATQVVETQNNRPLPPP